MSNRLTGLLNVVRRELDLQDAPPWAVKNLLHKIGGYFYDNNLSIYHAHEMPYGRSPAHYAIARMDGLLPDRTNAGTSHMYEPLPGRTIGETARMYELMQEAAFRPVKPPAFADCDFALKQEVAIMDTDKKEMKPKPVNRAVELLEAEAQALQARLDVQRKDQNTYQHHANTYKKSADATEAKLKQVTSAIKKIS